MPVPPSYKTHNVASELKDPNSVLHFYKHLLTLRHENRALLDGQYIPLNENAPNMLSYLRLYKSEAVLVVLNMAGTEQKVSFDLTPQGLSSAKATTLLTTLKAHPQEVPLSQISMEPFAVYIAKVSR